MARARPHASLVGRKHPVDSPALDNLPRLFAPRQPRTDAVEHAVAERKCRRQANRKPMSSLGGRRPTGKRLETSGRDLEPLRRAADRPEPAQGASARPRRRDGATQVAHRDVQRGQAGADGRPAPVHQRDGGFDAVLKVRSTPMGLFLKVMKGFREALRVSTTVMAGRSSLINVFTAMMNGPRAVMKAFRDVLPARWPSLPGSRPRGARARGG